MKKTLLAGLSVLSSLLILFTIDPVQAAPIEMKVTCLEGKSGYFAPGSTVWNPIALDQSMESGGKIKTWDNARVSIELGEQGAIRVLPKTMAKIDKMEQEKSSRSGQLSLDTGDLLLSLNPSPDQTDFKIKTPQGIAAARGTTYLAGTRGVTVLHGVVVMTTIKGKKVSIPAGYSLLTNGSVVLDKSLLEGALADFEVLHKAGGISPANYRQVRRAVQMAQIYKS